MSAVGVVEHNRCDLNTYTPAVPITCARIRPIDTLPSFAVHSTLILHSQLQNFALCKGAPEVIEKRLRNVPPRYEETYKYWARAGCRVLALGLKEIQGSYTMHQVRH